MKLISDVCIAENYPQPVRQATADPVNVKTPFRLMSAMPAKCLLLASEEGGSAAIKPYLRKCQRSGSSNPH
ncbi:hypothetical protein ACCT14_34630, partial [Rhizobium brockwellii]|uniref:hypothetical protein n=1 Tax=Rhizobium brockwellii TaxID=3019932 RepID=UPI003F9DE1E0